MASTKTETMLVWVELSPGCKLSAHLEHVGGFAANLHHVDKIVGGCGVDHLHICTTNAPIQHFCSQRLLEVRCKMTIEVRQMSFDITDIIRGWSKKGYKKDR